jgi:hypothetical protein
MRHWNGTIKNFHKGRYWNRERVFSVKAGKVHTAVHRAVGEYLDGLPRGTRVEGLNIRIEAYRPDKKKGGNDAELECE